MARRVTDHRRESTAALGAARAAEPPDAALHYADAQVSALLWLGEILAELVDIERARS